MISFSSLRPFLPYAGIAVVVGAMVFYVQSLRSENQSLQSQLGQKTQEVVALQESLRVVDRYESTGGVLRQLWATANDPGADTLSVPNEAQGRPTRRVQATVKTVEDTLSGKSDASGQENGRYKHEIRGAGYRGEIQVRPPGNRLQYRLRVLPKTETITLTETVDEAGVNRTYVDASSRISVANLSAQGSTELSAQAETPRWEVSWLAEAGVRVSEYRSVSYLRPGVSMGLNIGEAQLGIEITAGIERPFSRPQGYSGESYSGGNSRGGVSPVSNAAIFLRW